MTRLIVIRHGESETNISRHFTGQTDVALTDKGVRQAEIACDYILKNFKIDRIYSSDLQRAYNTVLPIAKALGAEINTTKDIREIYGGKWQGIHYDLLDDMFPEDREIYKTGKACSRCTGGESFGELYDRSVAGFLKIARENDGKTVLVGTHATPIRALICYSLGKSADELRTVEGVVNTSIHIFDVENDIVTLVRDNIGDHLVGECNGLSASSVGKET